MGGYALKLDKWGNLASSASAAGTSINILQMLSLEVRLIARPRAVPDNVSANKHRRITGREMRLNPLQRCWLFYPDRQVGIRSQSGCCIKTTYPKCALAGDRLENNCFLDRPPRLCVLAYYFSIPY